MCSSVFQSHSGAKNKYRLTERLTFTLESLLGSWSFHWSLRSGLCTNLAITRGLRPHKFDFQKQSFSANWQLLMHRFDVTRKLKLWNHTAIGVQLLVCLWSTISNLSMRHHNWTANAIGLQLPVQCNYPWAAMPRLRTEKPRANASAIACGQCGILA
jgi:hypothetical protein